MPTPEELAREIIDQKLTAAGWIIQDMAELNRFAGVGVAAREFTLETGEADYLLFVDGKAAGILEAKPEGTTLAGVAEQAGRYAVGLPANIPHVTLPLPFQYESTGVETLFRDNRDPNSRSRHVFSFHQPETLAEWLREENTFRGRLQTLPPLIPGELWSAQIEAIRNLEGALAQDRPRSLIQMATGSGKTFTAVNFIYRLIKFGRARRVLFLVDRSNLARQTLKAFQAFTTPDDGRKFSELYNVSRLTSNVIDPVNKVVITTIQRLYSILSNEAEFEAENEEGSLFEMDGLLQDQPAKLVRYNPRLPVEFFDVIVTDECHRSIYNLWRQVLEYFDAHIIGLTATPSKQTLGFFQQNLVMEYPRYRAVADGVNVDGEVYRISTRITDKGNTIETGEWVTRRDKLTREERLELLDQDFSYDPVALNRSVLAPNQIRTIIETYKARLFTELFPERKEVPKTLIFAQDDAHAEEITHIVREVFGRGDDFCKKITYRVSGVDPEDLIKEFRTGYLPRIAVTVDMVATGTDIKPVEALIFMRAVRSRILFEQMIGRGTRVIKDADLQVLNHEGVQKERFLIVDAVGVTEQEKVDAGTLERKRSTSFAKLMEAVAKGAVDEDVLSSLAGRLIRLQRRMSKEDQKEVEGLAGETGLARIVDQLLEAVADERQENEARRRFGDGDPAFEVSPVQMEQAAQDLLDEAARPLAANPDLRNKLIEIQARREMLIDPHADETTQAAFDPQAREKWLEKVESFRAFIETNKDELTALQILYSQPYGARRLTYGAVKELAEAIKLPPYNLTPEELWRAYERLDKSRVRGAGPSKLLTEVISLVRFALAQRETLEPFPLTVEERYRHWILDQEEAGRTFSAEQLEWLGMIKDHIAASVTIEMEDFEDVPFNQKGGAIRVSQLFGAELDGILDELSQALVG